MGLGAKRSKVVVEEENAENAMEGQSTPHTS